MADDPDTIDKTRREGVWMSTLGSQWLSVWQRSAAGAASALSTVSQTFYPVRGGRVSQAPRAGHEALDIAAALGSPVYTPRGGRVTAINVEQGTPSFGLNVRVLTAQGLEEVFAHLQSAVVRIGDTIRAGQQVGSLGRSGTAESHLHFEVRVPGTDVFNHQWSTTTAVDPVAFLAGATQPRGGGALPTIIAPQVSVTPAQAFGLSTPTTTPTVIPATTGALAMLGGQGAVAGQKTAPADTGGLLGDVGGSIVRAAAPYTKRGFLIAGGFALVLIGAVMFAMSFNQVREGITSTAKTALKVAPLVAA